MDLRIGPEASTVALKIGMARQTQDIAGVGGPVFVQPAPEPSPVAPAMLESARSVGIPTFQSQNGQMMEGDGGASIMDLRVRDGRRQSIFRSYVYPYMDRPNLTVLCHALVTRLVMRGKQATGVEVVHDGTVRRIGAGAGGYPVVGRDQHAEGADAVRNRRPNRTETAGNTSSAAPSRRRGKLSGPCRL